MKTQKCDVTKEEDVKSAIDACVKAFGGLHVAINSAGVATVSPMLTSRGAIDLDLFKKTIEINVFGTMYVSKHAAIQMSKQEKLNDRGERGVIVHVSSVAA